MASPAFNAIKRHITVAWPNLVDKEAKELLLKTAYATHAKILQDQKARGGVEPEWEAYANHPGNSNLESVRLPGPIVYTYRYRREILLVAMAYLRSLSPVNSGRYRDSHTIYVNGIPVSDRTDIKPGMDVWIANPVPYARRLEIGRTTSGRPFLIQVPNRIYERTQKYLQNRYRNAANITFGYVTVPGAWIIKGRLPAHYVGAGGVRKKRRQHIGEAVRSPAIFIDLLGK